jgi:hypothetical protein
MATKFIRGAEPIGKPSEVASATEMHTEGSDNKLEHRRTVIEMHLLVSTKRGLERGSTVTEENVARALESPILGYDRPRAERVARELLDAFTKPIGSVATKNLEKADDLVKAALLIRDDVTSDIMHRVIPKLDRQLLEAITEKFGLERSRTSIVDKIIEDWDKIGQGTMSTIYTDYKIGFTQVAKAQFERGYALEGNKIDDYHIMARLLPRLKLNPFGSSNGSPSRGKYHNGNKKFTGSDGTRYDVYHAGSSRGDLRADYIVTKDHTVLITEFYMHSIKNKNRV